MNLNELVRRQSKPAPWAEGDNIPWNEPGFSERMLKEHLSQNHDAASRRYDVIDQHVAWIHQDLLGGKPGRVLDLGCGPGLYAQRLARLGHKVVGIDYSPASLRYARQAAQQEGLDCTYLSGDLREVEYGGGFDLVMQIYGEINVFSPANARCILSKALAALKEQGLLLLEVHDYPVIHKMGQGEANWHTAPSGLFSDQPYLYLGKSFWDEASQTTTERMYVVDTHSAEVTRFAQSLQAYDDSGYVDLLEGCGFSQVQFFPGMGGDLGAARGDLFPLLARKISPQD